MSRTVIALMSWLAVAVVGPGGAPAQAPESSAQTSGSLAQQFFHVEYSVGAHRPGRSEISGYVYNDYGQSAINVAIEITEMDADSRPAGTVTRPVVGSVPGNGRAYFDVWVPESTSYHVNVGTFELMEFGDNGI